MKIKLLVYLSSTIMAVTSLSLWAEQVNVADDDANQNAYSGGWDNGKNGGSGFGGWTLTTEGNDENRHAGFFIADVEHNPDLNGIATKGKAFGTFANGIGFEQAVAYRPFEKPMAIGDSFSFSIEHGSLDKKFDKDDVASGSVGLTLRSGNAVESVSDYNKDALFEFGFYKGRDTYQLYDGSPEGDTKVPWSDAGVSVTVTLTGEESYDLEIVNLKDKKITKLPGRKLKAKGKIESFAIFNRNGEQSDTFFNSFQVARNVK